MPAALPFTTKHGIAAELRLGSARTDDAVLRTLRDRHAMSTGISAPMRATTGRVLGRLHLYSSLNRDAARALRRGHAEMASALADAARRVEQRTSARRIFEAALDASVVSSRGLADVMRHANLAAAMTDAGEAIAAERHRLGIMPVDAIAFGYVASLADAIATLTLSSGQLTVPRKILVDEGLDETGIPVMVRWEILDGGTSLLAVEPAVATEADAAPELAPAPVDRFAVPWGQVLSDDDGQWLNAAMADRREPTVRRPGEPVTIRG